jgi:hypothetical protein
MPAVAILQPTSWNDLVTAGLGQSSSWNEADSGDEVDPATCPDTICADVKSPTCQTSFGQVNVDHLIAGESRITWSMADGFSLIAPAAFQLQVGGTGLPDADDWTNVGPPIANAWFLTDPARRDYGQQLTTHYRVVLINGDGQTYYSEPVQPNGGLTFREWGLAREYLRAARVQLLQPGGSMDGFLLKRRRDGTPCSVCLDPITGETNDSRCPQCFGVGFTYGYFKPYPCSLVRPSQETFDERLNTAVPPGITLSPLAMVGTFLGLPRLSSWDVWVDYKADLRYYLHKVTNTVRIRHLILACDVEMWQADFHDRIYDFPVPRVF